MLAENGVYKGKQHDTLQNSMMPVALPWMRVPNVSQVPTSRPDVILQRKQTVG
jgi:hypothetical protein